jgi:hypothetical protein
MKWRADRGRRPGPEPRPEDRQGTPEGGGLPSA